ncbi:MAG: hypothetical protein PQJ28_04515 [Spirochaetales bacterium]|nr:hypothetical protein [Spirochaetales bacterium]
MKIHLDNLAFAGLFIACGIWGIGGGDIQWKYGGPMVPEWTTYIMLACGIIMLCMELWAARKRK